MPTLFIDWETDFDEKAGLTLKKMALRAYLREAPMVGFSFAIDDGPFTWVDTKNPDFLALCAEISDFGQEPGNIIAAYNAPFDCRVGRFGRLTRGGEPLGMEWPETIHDAMEFAMAAWPNMPGGYPLRNVAAWLNLPPKLSIQDVIAGKVSWEDYCNRDGELLRQIYWRAIRRLSPEEIYYAENCNRVRGLAYTINDATVASSLAAFTANTEAGVAAAVEFLSSYARDGEDLGDTIFGGYADGKVRSVKAKALKDLLVSALGFATTSTSLKKINPSHLAQRPDVAELLRSTTKANKGLYYQKRTTALVGASEMDMEKGYFRATNTGRTSAPTCGRGVNVANLTKKDKTIAKPLRQMLALPDHLCYVRIDAANVEYRVNGLLTDCAHITKMFSQDIDADPYAIFAKAGFGVSCKKGEPMRDVVSKAAVLGYGFCISEGTPILTRLGWKPIEAITKEDELWDGVNWVKSKGAVYTGTKPVIHLSGVALTPEHRVLCRTGWHSAEEIVSSGGTLRPLLAPDSDDGRLWEPNGTSAPREGWSAVASAVPSQPSAWTSCGAASATNARDARVPGTASEAEVAPASTMISSPTPVCEGDGKPRGTTSTSGATDPRTRTSPATGGEVSWSGSLDRASSLPTLSLCPDGTTGTSNSIGWTTTEGMKPGTSAWRLPRRTGTIRRAVRVYDIVDAGPNHRFQAGTLLVHNCMGLMRAIEEFNKSVADPINNVSVRDIEQLCFDRGWSMPTSRYLKGAVTRVGCHWSIAVAANEAHTAFRALHPEIFTTADWLVRSVEMLAGSKDPDRLIDVLYSFSGAPDRNKLNLSIDRQLEFPTVRVTLFGHSIPTVTWRHLSVSHPGVDGLGAVTANKGPRRFHRALAIENVVQSSARIGLMRCENEFTRRTGWLTDSVYDEILAIVPRDRDCVLTARREMVDIMSPHGPHGMGWAFYGKPEEVTVTRTRYEDEKESKIAFAKLEANDPTWKEHLH